MKNFKGVFTALLTPFTVDGKVNETALARLIERNIKSGVDGFYCCGSTAEVFMMSLDQRKALMKTIVDINKGRVTLIAHVGAVSTDECVDLAKCAYDLGYDAVSAVAPFYYKFSYDEIVAHYNAIASATPLKCIVYNIPAFSGVNFSAQQLGDLIAGDNFLGLKNTALDCFTIETVKSHHSDKLVYNGYDEMFLSGLAAGCDGGIGSTYNFMAEKYVKILNLFNEGKMKEALAVQHECNEIITSLCKVGVMAGEKAVLNILGYDFGDCRLPYKSCDKDAYALIEREIMPYVMAD